MKNNKRIDISQVCDWPSLLHFMNTMAGDIEETRRMVNNLTDKINGLNGKLNVFEIRFNDCLKRIKTVVGKSDLFD